MCKIRSSSFIANPLIFSTFEKFSFVKFMPFEALINWVNVNVNYRRRRWRVIFCRRLSEELHALLRVMWSGKWALVSPHKMLNAVWQMIPFFKGYSQQDAQEFLW